MKGKTVFVLMVRQVYDGELLRNDCRVFADLDDAKQSMKKFVDDEKHYVKRDEWLVVTDDDILFEAYLEGDYNSNHTEAVITEKEVH